MSTSDRPIKIGPPPVYCTVCVKPFNRLTSYWEPRSSHFTIEAECHGQKRTVVIGPSAALSSGKLTLGQLSPLVDLGYPEDELMRLLGLQPSEAVENAVLEKRRHAEDMCAALEIWSRT